MIADAIEFLARTQNADGGWGAAPDRQSNSETTAIAVMALRAWNEQTAPSSVERGIAWLLTLQAPDGSWPIRRDVEGPSWATALATLCLASFGEHRHRAHAGARWLVEQRGRRLGWFASLLYRVAPERMGAQLNPDLQAWSWTRGAFSWVEPTAYALMALKKLGPSGAGPARERIDEGERLLYDRMCEGGGWNYGNSKVLGVPLDPYPETTAVALIALQDRRADAANQLSLKRLMALTGEVPSGLSLSWATLGLSIYGHPVGEWRRRLVRLFGKTRFLEDTRTIALALLAMSDRPGDFHLAR